MKDEFVEDVHCVLLTCNPLHMFLAAGGLEARQIQAAELLHGWVDVITCTFVPCALCVHDMLMSASLKIC